MKKLIVLLLVLITLNGCSNRDTYYAPIGDYFDMSGYNLESTHFYNVSYQQVINMIEEKKTIIVYFGYEDCPWCNEIVRIIQQVCDEQEVDIYYVDVKSQQSLDDKDGLNYFINYSAQTNREGENILYFPTIMFIKKGELVNSHIGTVSGHDALEKEMDENQRIRCKYLVSRKFKEVLD